MLGYLDASHFLGGEMVLDAEAARRGIEERLAQPLGVPLLQVVWGIHDLVTSASVSELDYNHGFVEVTGVSATVRITRLDDTGAASSAA